MKDSFEFVIESAPSPWAVVPLVGKHYGTLVSDATGDHILCFWGGDNPSERQKSVWGTGWEKEYPCDSHYESQLAFDLASSVVEIRNSAEESDIKNALLAALLRSSEVKR